MCLLIYDYKLRIWMIKSIDLCLSWFYSWLYGINLSSFNQKSHLELVRWWDDLLEWGSSWASPCPAVSKWIVLTYICWKPLFLGAGHGSPTHFWALKRPQSVRKQCSQERTRQPSLSRSFRVCFNWSIAVLEPSIVRHLLEFLVLLSLKSRRSVLLNRSQKF